MSTQAQKAPRWQVAELRPETKSCYVSPHFAFNHRDSLMVGTDPTHHSLHAPGPGWAPQGMLAELSWPDVKSMKVCSAEWADALEGVLQGYSQSHLLPVRLGLSSPRQG